MKKLLPLSFAFLLLSLVLNAQVNVSHSVISAGGGFHENENLSLSWTLGQLAVSTLSSGDMVLTQGFQQTWDINVGFSDTDESSWSISVYPNPVKHQLRIAFDILQTGDFILELQDVSGRIITQKSHKNVAPGDIVQLNTSIYAPGIYFLLVIDSKQKQVRVTSLHKL